MKTYTQTALLLLVMLTSALLCGGTKAAAMDVAAPLMRAPEDTVKAEKLMSLPGIQHDNTGHNCAVIARALIGSKGDDYYFTDPSGALRINTSTFTPITFINTVAALAKTSASYKRPTWRDFTKNLENYSCRRGEDKGFTSLIWHASDWVGDNTYRGNVRELTGDYQGVIERTKSLDYLTRHRDEFAALADSATYETVRMTEMGFRTHRVSTLKKETIKKKEITEDLRDGDILILNPGQDGTDILIIGFIVKEPEGPSLIYYSPEKGEVVKVDEPLPSFFNLHTKRFNGYRIIRLRND